MSTKTRRSHESTGPRPTYFLLGVDGRDVSHVRDVGTQTVHLVHSDGSRERKIVPDGRLDEYMSAVTDAYGWRSQHYGCDLADLLGEVVDLEAMAE